MAVESRILKCKLGPLLQQDFKPFKNEFRVISEEHSILRRDAINFAYYMVVHWLENRDTGDPQTCPPLLQGQFWSHCYRLVSDYRNFRLDVDVAVNMAHRFIEFDNLRLNEAREYLYPRVQLDLLHATLANSYGVDIMTNIKLHLTRNIPVYQKRILKGFFMRYKIDNNLENLNPGQLAGEAFRYLFRLRVNQIDGLYGDQGEVHAVALRNFFRAQFNRWRNTFANTKLEFITDFSYATPARVATILQFYAALLNDIDLHNLNVKRWSLIPIATHQMVHVNFSSGPIIYLLLQRMRNEGPLPDIEVQHETGTLRFNQGTTRAEFTRHYRIPEFKEHLWQQIFRLDKLVKNRRLENEVNRDRPYQLAYGFKTDGHMISMHFYKDLQGRPPIPFDMGELRTMARKIDVSRWENGMVELIKEPIGLPNDCRIVGVDPGVRDLLCAVERVNVEGQEVNRKAFSISNAEYQVRSGRQWAQMKELQSREHAHIQEVYDLIASPKVHTITDFSLYVRSISQTHNRIFDFNRSYRHREIKGYLYSAKKMTLDYIADNIIGLYPLRVDNETYCKVMLPHKSTKKERRRARKRFRNESTGFRPPTQRTIVAFGDASINSSMKGHAPIPHQQQQRAIARKALLVRVDEYNTSQTCNVCSSHLENVYARENVCFEHRKRRKKIEGGQKRKKCCVGDDLSIISQASQCTQRTLHNVLIYPLKFCNQCPAGRSTVWNRDFNAAINIRNILAMYIENDYDINSRPTPLSRTRR